MPECATGSVIITKTSGVAERIVNLSISSKRIPAETQIRVLKSCEFVALVFAFPQTDLGSHGVTRESTREITAWFLVFVAALIV